MAELGESMGAALERLVQGHERRVSGAPGHGDRYPTHFARGRRQGRLAVLGTGGVRGLPGV